LHKEVVGVLSKVLFGSRSPIQPSEGLGFGAYKARAPRLSPDGRNVSFLSDFSGGWQVWRVADNLDAAPFLISHLDLTPVDLAVSPFLYRPGMVATCDCEGREVEQLFFLPDSPSEAAIALTSGYENARHVFGDWTADGSIVFASTRRDSRQFDLYLQPLGGQARRIWQNDRSGLLHSIFVSKNGAAVTFCRMQSTRQHELFEVSLCSGTVRRLFGGSARIHAAIPLDNRTMLVSTDQGSEFLRVISLDLETGEVMVLAEEPHDLECLAVPRDGRRAAYAINRDGVHELCVVDFEDGSARVIPLRFDEERPIVIEDRWLNFSADGSRLAFCAGTASSPALPFVYAIEEDLLVEVSWRTRRSFLSPPISPRLIHYQSFDGRSIPAWWYCRDGIDDFPVVLFLHGGPESQFRPSFRTEIAMLLREGFAVIAPNFRGSTGSGSTYEHLDDVDRRIDAVHDVAWAAKWVESQSGISCQGFVIWGASYGGLLALLAMAHYPDLWIVGITLNAITDLISFLERTSPWRRAFREAEYGSLAFDRELLEQISPVRLAHRIAAPVMIAHGANDPRVPPEQALALANRLEARGHPFALHLYPGEGHGFVLDKNRERFCSDALEFITGAFSLAGNRMHKNAQS
jgi:dipeptidyl aminopeptidase/acylaminoacyl peptidase